MMLSYIALAAAALLVGIDQLIKLLVDSSMTVGQSIPVWEGVLHWTYVRNEGAAFGIFQGQRWLLVGLTSILIIVGIYLLAAKKLKEPFLIWTACLIVSGGLGNLIDRIFRHFVIDYIEIRLINFAVFNFADCCVVIGTIMLVVYLLLGDWITKRLAMRRLAKHLEESEVAEPQPVEGEPIDINLPEERHVD